MEYGTKKKKKKRVEKKNGAEEEVEDIISSKLPESHITHIISLLPTKDAVRTCVLSRTWRNRWKSITRLDLDENLLFNTFPVCIFCSAVCKRYYYASDKYRFILCCPDCLQDRDRCTSSSTGNGVDFSDFRLHENRRKKNKKKTRTCSSSKIQQKHFVDFVHRAIFLSSTPLESFSLVIHNKYDESLLNVWIYNILNRTVNYLRIHSTYNILVSAYTSKLLFMSSALYLQEMELVSLLQYSTIKVPTSIATIHLGHLKLLKLSKIFFDINNHNKNLILNLPVLNKFEIIDLSWSSGKNIIVEAPLLESIYIEDRGQNKLGSYDDSIKLNTLNPKEFTYCGSYISHQIHLSNNFLSAKIIFQRWYRNSTVVDSQALSFLLLQQLHQVKSMEFEGSKVLTQSKVSTLPVFANLSHLELRFVTVQVLLSLLQKSPYLKKLVVKEIPRFPKKLLTSADVPDCLATALQFVKFEKVNGESHKLFLANFFIQNGKMLEKMELSLATQSLDKASMEKKLCSFKKGFSSSCSVQFSYAY